MDASELYDLAAAQRAYIRRDQARGQGFSAKTQRGWIARGEWIPEGPRLLRRAGASTDRGTPLMRAVLDAGVGSHVSCVTAAAWWGLPGYDLLRPHVTRPRGTGRGATFAGHVHEVVTLSSDQVTVLDGIPIVRPERLALELFAETHPLRAARAIETAWSKGLLSGASLRATLDELAASGRTGVAALREFLDARPDDWVPPASNVEARFADIMATAGLGTWRRQVNVGETRWVGRVDFLHDRRPLIVEVQSERYHAALVDRAADAARIAALTDAGFTVVEVWDTWIWHDKRRVIDAVRSAFPLAA